MKNVFGFIGLLVFSSCSLNQKIAKVAKREIVNDSVLIPAHVGIAVYDTEAGKYLYQYQGNKYFVPASNTKLFSLYAGIKYLGDSIPGLKYYETADTLYIQPTGDPSLLHPDFTSQRVADFLKSKNKPIVINEMNWKEEPWGYGWAWDDYNDDYMAERSPLPVYGNTIRWLQAVDKQTKQVTIRSTPFLKWQQNKPTEAAGNKFLVKRKRDENYFQITTGTENAAQEVPFVTNGIETAKLFLSDSLKLNLSSSLSAFNHPLFTIHSIPADSLYKLMMYRSDNFFAEQTLLMAANEKLGIMNDEAMIAYLKKNDLKDIPQQPKWVDGSGLSRYNLFTPQSFVWLLNKMKNEFGLARMEALLPTGGLGTLSNLYAEEKGFIFAKTGTLSNNTSLSGYLITKKNKLLIFSLQAGNFQGSAAPVRLAYERFIKYLRSNY
ncbi:MAG: D-alanyl-D-alanine carboxypeptidase/D-alanyl-D-alanine-endopeptidase [Sphingobacteriales bacterium]|nr:MAG: D-alanyl-D-alanine carboxypeptidase/D-alanyl-D-alanine-endopeptidase [Sphingobacteriales bacterium]